MDWRMGVKGHEKISGEPKVMTESSVVARSRKSSVWRYSK